MKVIIPAAGMGTRLLPATKEQPKEMLPLFARASGGQVCLKPLLQLVFEQLYDVGFREFYFIIGREKRAIEDHFTPDSSYVGMLKRKKKNELAGELENFYQKIENSTIVWVNQPEPKGFGDAVLKAAGFAGDEPVLVHAGDTYVISDHDRHMRNLITTHEKFGADATCVLQWVRDPRQYGVAEVGKAKGGVYEVKKVVEKPEKPTSNLAIMPIYIFCPVIFEALKETPPGKGNEIQLTDGIQKLIDWERRVHAVKLSPRDIRLDIGTIETYWDAFETSYRYATRGRKWLGKRKWSS
jgi:UTP--glucose-1-phosphate uridylyltransferase